MVAFLALLPHPVVLLPNKTDATAILTQGVLADLYMPKMDGITLIKELRALPAYELTPILMLTTEADVAKMREGKDAGATGWVVKPFDPDQFIFTVKAVLR